MTIHDAREVFTTDLIVRAVSNKTIEHYDHTLDKLIMLSGQKPISDLQSEARNFFFDARKKNYSERTIYGFFVDLRAFCRFCHQEKYLADPVILPKIKKPKPKIKSLTIAQVRQLLRHARKGNTFYSTRNYALVYLMYDTGIRLGELAGLDIGDIDWRYGTLKVIGKGNKERVLGIGKAAKKALWQWAKIRENSAGCDALFTNQWGNRYGYQGINEWFAKARRKLKLPHLSAHVMRHTFACHFLARGDVRTLQDALGHTDPSMSLMYASMTQETSIQRQQENSPGDYI